MLSIKKMSVAMLIHNMALSTIISGLSPKKPSKRPVMSPLSKLTICVNGNPAIAIVWIELGIIDKGTKVPPMRNIGVISKYTG